MKIHQIHSKDNKGASINTTIDKFPDQCPFCRKSITASFQGAYHFQTCLESLFRCPDGDCQKVFLSYYDYRSQTAPQWILAKSMSGTLKTRVFSNNIEGLSPSFILIYNQAITAEFEGLDEITGIGLRKAFEFLIKDYAIKNHPDKREDIEKKLLGLCIKDFIDNTKIKEMAARAVWLGNDHTHYVKKWEDKDINDLKRLIDITLHWIEMELETERYMAEMQ